MERRRRVLEQAELCKSEVQSCFSSNYCYYQLPADSHRILWLDFANAQTEAQTVKAEKEVVDKEL